MITILRMSCRRGMKGTSAGVGDCNYDECLRKSVERLRDLNRRKWRLGNQPLVEFMKISTIPSIYRNINRLTEIVKVLSKYGLADWLSSLQLEFAKDFLQCLVLLRAFSIAHREDFL